MTGQREREPAFHTFHIQQIFRRFLLAWDQHGHRRRLDAYVVNYADDVAANDVVFEDKGVKVIVDPEALPLIDGTEVDFVKNGLNEAFSFRNPNISGECGCGESFTV